MVELLGRMSPNAPCLPIIAKRQVYTGINSWSVKHCVGPLSISQLHHRMTDTGR